MKTKAVCIPGLSRNTWKEMPTRKLEAAIYMDQELKSKCSVTIDGGRAYAFDSRRTKPHYIPSLKITVTTQRYDVPIRVFWGTWWNYYQCKTSYQGFVIGPTYSNYGKSHKACTYERAIKIIKEIVKHVEEYEILMLQKDNEYMEEQGQIKKVKEIVSKKLKTPETISISQFHDWVCNIKTGLTFSFRLAENIHDEKVRRNMTLKPTDSVFRNFMIEGKISFKNMQRLIKCLKTFE